MSLLKSDPDAMERGASAPDFSLLNTVDGSTVSLSDFSGKAVCVIFMCNHCPFVIPKFEEIAQLQNDFASKEVVVIGISSNSPEIVADDGPEQMKQVAGEQGFTHYLFDESQEVARAYGAVCTPDPFVFDKQHKLVFHGRINDAMSPDSVATTHDLREVLDKLVANEPIEEWFEPSQGCSIKWK
ncbi:MAG: thioredoxin family protein [Nanoarchaeota archaeon]|nr:thioredoxin family protein [Nanoarchaeota archaeon]